MNQSHRSIHHSYYLRCFPVECTDQMVHYGIIVYAVTLMKDMHLFPVIDLYGTFENKYKFFAFMG